MSKDEDRVKRFKAKVPTKIDITIVVLLLSVISITSMILAQNVYAHDAAKTHPEITNQAIGLFDSSLAFSKEILADKGNYKQKILTGSEEEDYPEAISVINLGTHGLYNRLFERSRSIPFTTPIWEGFVFQDAPFMTHFYNPVTKKGLFPISPNAPAYSQKYLDKAVTYYQGSGLATRDKNKAYYVLGRSIHLLEDMGVPAHTNGDIHGLLVNGDNFENYVRDRIENKESIIGDAALKPKKISSIRQASTDLSKLSHKANEYDIWDVRFLPPWRYYEKPKEKYVYYREDLNDDELHTMMLNLVPETINWVAGALDYFWKKATGAPIDNSRPGGDNPDENYSVSSASGAEPLSANGNLDSYLRLAIKKNKPGLLMYQAITNEFNNYLNLPSESTEGVFGIQEQKIHDLEASVNENSLRYDNDYETTPDIAVLNNGFHEAVKGILISQKEPFVEIDKDFSPQIAKDHPVLIIPSGGLYGLDTSPSFTARLEKYANLGGTIIAFDQQYGKEYLALPGSELYGQGWREAISCRGKCAEIDTYESMLSGLNDVIASTYQDGYFTKYPENSTILLRGTTRAEGRPVMLMYPFGNGRVIATSIYSDWAYGMKWASSEEVALVQNLFTWAKNPASIPEFGRGEAATLTQTIHNITNIPATKVKLTLLDPDRRSVFTEIQDLSVAPDEEKSITFTRIAPSKLGIYFVDYTLLDETGTVVQPQAEGARFAVSKFKASESGFVYRGSGISSTITMVDERLPQGDDAIFTIHLYNGGDIDSNVIVNYGSGQVQEKRNITIPAQGEESFNYMIPKVRSSGALKVEVKDEDRKDTLCSTSKGYWVFSPSVTISAKTDKKQYLRGESVPVTLNLKNTIIDSYDAKLKIRLVDPSGATIDETDTTVAISRNADVNQQLNISIPADAVFGFYAINCEAFKGSAKIGVGATSFELPVARLAIKALAPDRFSGLTTVSYKIDNISNMDSQNANLSLSLKDSEGNELWTDDSRVFDLAAGQTTVINAQVPMSDLKFGDYRLIHKVAHEGKPLTGEVVLPVSMKIEPTFDKSSYRIRENLGISLKLENDGKYDLRNASCELTIPDAGIVETGTLNLNVDETTTVPFSLTLPSTMTAGQHDINFKVQLFGNSGTSSTLSKSYKFTIPKSKVGFSLPETEYAAGDSIAVEIKNAGGIDTEAIYGIALTDEQGLQIYGESTSTPLLAGQAKNIQVVIPVQAATGTYHLSIAGHDDVSGKEVALIKNLHVDGVSALIDSHTGNSEYLTTDPKNVLSTIYPQGSSIANGTLNLKVTRVNPLALPLDSTPGPIADNNITFDHRGLSEMLEINNDYLDVVVDNYEDMPPVFTATAITEIGTTLADEVIDQAVKDYFRNQGCFSIGTAGGDLENTDDDWKPLLHDHPNPGPSIATVMIDGDYYLYGTYPGYFSSEPHFEGNDIVSTWQVDNVSVTQTLSIGYSSSGLPDVGHVKYDIDNYDSVVHSVGIRLLMDTRLGENDSPAIVLPGIGLIATEQVFFDGEIPAKWTAMDSLENTTITAKGILESLGVAKPDVFAVANWSTLYNVPWDFGGGGVATAAAVDEGDFAAASIDTGVDIEDGAVALYWNPTDIAADGSRSVSTQYGVASAQSSTGSGDIEETVWETNIPINASADTSITTDMDMPQINGKFNLIATLKSETSQKLAENKSSFYVTDDGVLLKLDPVKHLYKPGDIVTVNGEVRNGSDIDLEDRRLEIFKEDELIYSETMDIAAGDFKPFSFTTTSDETFTLTAQFGSKSVADFVEIVEPVVEIKVNAPEVVGREPFSIDVAIKNTSIIDANLSLDFADQNQALSHEDILLEAGETRLITKTYTIIETTDYEVRLSGDASSTVNRTVAFGEKAWIALDISDIYLEGDDVQIPFAAINAGLLETEFPISFSLLSADGQNELLGIEKTVCLPITKYVVDDLYLGKLAQGEYRLKVVTPFETIERSFGVAKKDQLELTADVAKIIDEVPGSSTPTSTPGTQIEVSGTVKNIGCNDFQGALTVDSDFDMQERGVEVEQGKDITYRFVLDAKAATLGNHEINIAVVDEGGNIVQTITKFYEVKSARFEVLEAPSGLVFNPSDNAAMSFKLKNTGDAEGEAVVDLNVLGVEQQSESVWLQPGETDTVSFSVQIPADLEEDDYKAVYSINGGNETEFTYHVNGIKMTVEASLDKQMYGDGDIAMLTLDIYRQDALENLDLYVKALTGTNEVSKDFIMDGHQSVTLQIPVQAGQDRLFYGVYTQSGRALYLNSLYIRQADETITLIPDKQVYEPGDLVNVDVKTELSGEMTVTATEYSESMNISGETPFSFTLPQVLKSGTYTIDYEFGWVANGETTITIGSVPIDVKGYTVKVVKADLNKAVYNPSDMFGVSLVLEANQGIPSTIKGWVYNPQEEFTEVFSMDRNLQEGENTIEATGTIDTQLAGTHRLVYAVYTQDDSNLLLTSGQENFDIEGPALVSLSTENVEYEASETANVLVEIYGIGSGHLKLFKDDEIVNEEDIDFAGYKLLQIPAGSSSVGIHELRAELDGAVDSSVTAEFQVVGLSSSTVTTTMAVVGQEGNNGWYTSDVTATLTAISDSGDSNIQSTEYSLDGSNWSLYSSPFEISSEGTTTVYYRSTSVSGMVEPFKTQIIRIDKTAPEIVIGSPVNKKEYILNEKIFANWSASDGVSLLDSSATVGSVNSGEYIDTSAVGETTFTVTASDNAGNIATKTITYYVRYKYGGLLWPMKDNATTCFLRGVPVPLMFQLKDADGKYIGNASAKVYLAKIVDGNVGEEIKATSILGTKVDNNFLYLCIFKQYLYTLKTSNLSKGIWQIRIALDDGSSKYAKVSLK